MLMNIEKIWGSFNKQGRPKCFNCNTYKYMARECKKPKKSRETRKYYKYDKVGHLAKDYRFKQKMIIRKNQEKTDKSDEEDEKKDFVKGLE